MVHKRELEKDVQALSYVRVPDSNAELQKIAWCLILGMGFQTKEGYLGVINQLGSDASIQKHTPLLSQDHLNPMIPNALEVLQSRFVYQTDVVAKNPCKQYFMKSPP